MPHLQNRSSAPPNSGPVHSGYTLPALLNEVCDRHPNPHALHQWVNHSWQAMSNQAFRRTAEELALGLLQLPLQRGDRVSLFMQSDLHFCIADMACLLAGLVDVPIDLGLNPEAIQFILHQTESSAIVCSNLDLLRQLAPCLQDSPVCLIMLANAPDGWQSQLPDLPPAIQVTTLENVRQQGQSHWSDQTHAQLHDAIAPDDLATIVYVPGPTEQLRGVMLTHQSLSGDILAAFGGIPDLQSEAEAALLFLPLTHIFARAFLYGHLYYSHRIYFSTPSRVSRHLRDVQPTLFITVPRFLEKAYETILENGNQLTGLRRAVFYWALHLAKRYRLEQKPSGYYAWQLKLADKLVFSQWRSGFGGRIKYLICGGAALRAELATVFSAAGIPILQGYGLTESSSVLCYNRGTFNRAGTVGVPIAGVEIAIAPDGEVLAKTPYVMQGYYKNPHATHQAIDAEGWLHTGDLGELTADGFLKITGYKKNLFKLSTGKYISPQPIEHQLKQSPLVKQAIVVGAQQKFCALLIFPNLDYLCPQIDGMCTELSPDALLKHARIMGLYQALVDEVNHTLPHWSTIKRFRLLHLTLMVEQGMPLPMITIKRDAVNQLFATEIDRMYTDSDHDHVPPERTKRKQPVSSSTESSLEQRLSLRIPISMMLRPRLLRSLTTRIKPSQAEGTSHHA
jgi:long-chain acyl-CoA synthetase